MGIGCQMCLCISFYLQKKSGFYVSFFCWKVLKILFMKFFVERLCVRCLGCEWRVVVVWNFVARFFADCEVVVVRDLVLGYSIL